MPAKALVLDANILIRAVLGKRARELIETHFETVSFFVPEAFGEPGLSLRHSPSSRQRRLDIETFGFRPFARPVKDEIVDERPRHDGNP